MTIPIIAKDDWVESEHPRGQPNNAGQFAPKGGGTAGSLVVQGKPQQTSSAANSTGTEFVSPNVSENLSLTKAIKAVSSPRHAMIAQAGREVDHLVGIPSHDKPVIGAWADGAENSIMTELENPTWDQLRMSAAMKGYIANQKQVLAFKQEPGGKEFLARINTSEKDPSVVHKYLLDNGLPFHTLQVSPDGVGVIVYGMDEDTAKAVVNAGEHYGHTPSFTAGRGEFIGTEKSDGTDAEQRADARRIYSRLVESTGGRDIAAKWEGLRDRYAEAPGNWLDDLARNYDATGVETSAKASVAAGAKAFKGEPLNGVRGHPASIATQQPSAKGKNAAEKAELDRQRNFEYQQPGLENMKRDPASFMHNINLLSDKRFYPQLDLKPATTPEEAEANARKAIDVFKANLSKLLSVFPEKLQTGSRLWYDGGRMLIDAQAKKYGLSDASVAAVYASLSPQKDWEQNIALGNAVIDTYVNHQDSTFDDAMVAAIPQTLLTSKTNGAKYTEMFKELAGKKLSELKTPVEKAAFIQMFNLAHGSRNYQVAHPDGTFGGLSMGQKGPNKFAWSGLATTGTAVSALEANGDRSKISELMGSQNKVRSFYNNLLDPHSPNGDVTIDTHAVGAALLEPVASEAAVVHHNFGSAPMLNKKPEGFQATKGHAATGNGSLYGLYATAYRELAKEKGLEPRQLQSIAWEAKRWLFNNSGPKERDAEKAIWREPGTFKYRQNRVVNYALNTLKGKPDNSEPERLAA